MASTEEAALGRRAIEWPTLVVAAAIYLGFALLTWHHSLLPWWVVLPLGAALVAWHGSLQHEVVHGHPTPWRVINLALVFPNLWLWLPYLLYERTHLDHHRTGVLTDPLDDPESYYVTPERWERMSVLGRRLLAWRNTLVGRLALGPLESVWILLRQEIGRVVHGDGSNAVTWLLHIGGASLVLLWVTAVCGIEWWAYVLLYAYPGLSLTLLRSFAEHQANPEPRQRTIIVEADPVSALLFLNNNLHAVHHDRPETPWYRLPALLSAERARWLGHPESYWFPGYLAVARAYLLRSKEPVLHPGQPGAG